MEILQHVIVTLAAVVAAAVVGRRVIGVARSPKPACSNCASAKSACAPAPDTARPRPMFLVRSSRASR
jgi:hypothetical protein